MTGTCPPPCSFPVKLTACRASRHTELDFTVVVNPNSGPGRDPLPDENYQREIQKIYEHPNIRPLGYVATTYGVKDLQLLRAEIAAYAKWGVLQPKLAMTGIFFDETPWQYDAQLVEYLTQASSAVRNQTGWAATNSVVGKSLPPMQVHNPFLHTEKTLRVSGLCACSRSSSSASVAIRRARSWARCVAIGHGQDFRCASSRER